MKPRVFALLPLLLFAALLGGCRQAQQVQSQQSLVMGTLATITVYAPRNTATDAALQAAFRTLDEINHIWHPWTPDATLARFNQALHTRQWVPVPADLQPLLLEALRLSRASRGNFDPGLGELTALWGFREAPEPGIERAPPIPSRITALLRQGIGVKHLQLRQDPQHGLMARTDTPTLTLDFGAIAKGYAVDRVVAQLERAGIENAIVNLGGNLRVLGSKGDSPWRIGIRAPRGDGTIAAIRNQGDMSVLTSGDYERYFIHQGQRFHHILHPRSGAPARGLISVTVVTDNATLGDAASTALFVAGPRQWPQVARALGVDKVLVVEDSGQVWVTPALQPLLELAPGVRAQVRDLSAPRQTKRPAA